MTILIGIITNIYKGVGGVCESIVAATDVTAAAGVVRSRRRGWVRWCYW